MSRLPFFALVPILVACSSEPTTNPIDAGQGGNGGASGSSAGTGGMLDAGNDVVDDVWRDVDEPSACETDPTCETPNAGIVEDCMLAGGCPIYKCWCEACLFIESVGYRCQYTCLTDGGICGG